MGDRAFDWRNRIDFVLVKLMVRTICLEVSFWKLCSLERRGASTIVSVFSSKKDLK